MSGAPRRPEASAASRDPYGVGLRRPLLAPAIALVGLAVAAVLTFGLFTGHIPLVGGSRGGAAAGGGGGTVARPPGATPQPNVVVTNKGVEPGPDGRVRLTIGAEDNGDGYWLDTGGRRRGFIVVRWLDNPNAPDVSIRLLDRETQR